MRRPPRAGADQRCIDARAFIWHSQRPFVGIEIPKMPKKTVPRRPLAYRPRPVRHQADQEGRRASPNTKAASSPPRKPNRLEARGNLYLYEINSRWTIDGTPRSNIARYFNHSCNPNAEIYDVKHRVFIRTLRDIKPGEEITYDYGIDYLKNVIGRSNCKCGRCRRRRAPQGARTARAAQAAAGAAARQAAEQGGIATRRRTAFARHAIPFCPCPLACGHARRPSSRHQRPDSPVTSDASTSACPPRAPTACRSAFSICSRATVMFAGSIAIVEMAGGQLFVRRGAVLPLRRLARRLRRC